MQVKITTISFMRTSF